MSVFKPLLNCINHLLFDYTIPHKNTQPNVVMLYPILTIYFILQTTIASFVFSLFHFNFFVFLVVKAAYRSQACAII